MSAVVSRNEPSFVVTPHARASRPSTQSVAAATANSTAASVRRRRRPGPRPSRAPSPPASRRIRRTVPAAMRRADRSRPEVTVGLPTRRAACYRAWSVTAPARAAACAAARSVARSAVLHRGDPARRHAQLAHPEAGQQHGGVRIAGQLAAHPHPPAVGLGGGAHGADQREHRRQRAREQRRERGVPALGGHRVLGEVVGADGEEVDVRRDPRRRRGRGQGPRPSRRPRAAGRARAPPARRPGARARRAARRAWRPSGT